MGRKFIFFYTFENILNDKVALSDHNQQSNMSPSEQTELLHIILLHQRQYEPYKSNAVQAERQESMVFD